MLLMSVASAAAEHIVEDSNALDLVDIEQTPAAVTAARGRGAELIHEQTRFSAGDAVVVRFGAANSALIGHFDQPSLRDRAPNGSVVSHATKNIRL